MKTKTSVRGGVQVADARVARAGTIGGRCAGVIEVQAVAAVVPPPVLTANVMAV